MVESLEGGRGGAQYFETIFYCKEHTCIRTQADVNT